jgi:glycosyltransferase involved in cell wall biosynthesis
MVLDAVLAQDYKLIEVIVIDDGSTDASRTIAESYGPPVVCLHQVHRGPGAARNAGVAASHGEFLALLDADGLWAPSQLRSQLALLKGGEGLDAVVGRVHDAEEHLVTLEERLPTAVSSISMLIRRESFLEVGPFSEDRDRDGILDWLDRAADRNLSFEAARTSHPSPAREDKSRSSESGRQWTSRATLHRGRSLRLSVRPGQSLR